MANSNSACICINCSSSLNSSSNTYYKLSSEFQIRPNGSKLRSGASDSSWKKQLTVSQALDFIFQVTDHYDDDSMDFSNYRLCNGCMTIFSPLFQLYLQFISSTGKDSPIHKVLQNGQLRRDLNELVLARIDDENLSSTRHTIQQSPESRLTSEESDNAGSALQLAEVKLEPELPEEEYKSDVFSDMDLGADDVEDLEPKYSRPKSRNMGTVDSNLRMGNLIDMPNQMKSSTSTKRSISISSKKKIFKCRKCSETFRFIHEINRHSRVHSGEAKFRCLICNCGFTTRVQQQNHIYKVHPEMLKKFIQCKWCRRRKFTSRVLFKRHLVKKHFHCSTCQLTFPTTEDINSHMVTVHGSDWMKHDCEFCDYKANRLQQFKDHQRRLHSTGGKNKKLTCEVCGKTFKTPGLLNFHVRFHSKGKFMCDECGVTYHRQISLNNHKLAVHPSGKMAMEDAPEMHNQCRICMERFTIPELLKKHAVVHTETGDGKYKCSICNCDFKTNKRQRQHMLKMHPAQTKPKKTKSDFPCHLCHLTLLSEVYLKQHLVRVHFHCPVCQQTSTTIEDITSHVETQHEPDCLKFACEFCEYKTRLFSCLQNHRLVRHSSEKQFTCEDCGKKFKTTSDLRRHEILHSHSDKRPFKCDQCKAAFYRQTNLTKHKLAVHPRVGSENVAKEDAQEIHNQCGKCGERFTAPEFLRMHAKVHTDTGDGKYKCTICNCDFTTGMRQQKHMVKMHPETRPTRRTRAISGKISDFHCHLCRIKLSSELHLKQHLVRVHFHCLVCEQTFTTKEDINSHMETQHGPDCLKFACELCEYKTKQLSDLRTHRLARHTEEGQFTCEICGKKFKILSALRDHQVSHSDERRFKCDQCEVTYKQRGGLAAHKRSVHSEIKLICEICGLVLNVRSSLKKHIDRVHRGIKKNKIKT